MRKVGTILSPECKNYAKDIEQLCDVPEYINLQFLRLIENLVCQRISEKVVELENTTDTSITVEIPLMGNLTITQQMWHYNHLKTGKPSTHFTYSFEPLPAFKSHIVNIFTSKDCQLVSLLSDSYAKQLVESYNDLL